MGRVLAGSLSVGPSGAGPVLAVPLAGDGCRRSDSQSGRTDARIAPARRTTYLHERLHIGPRSATTGTMTGTNKKLTAAVEAYCADLGRVRASGGATGERSSYGPLANLLNAIGAALKPKVFCVGELADQGVGHPDFGLYAVNQVQPASQRPDRKAAPPPEAPCRPYSVTRPLRGPRRPSTSPRTEWGGSGHAST